MACDGAAGNVVEDMRIDSKASGLGDAWMRFIALATLSKLRHTERHVIYPPAILVPLAREVFSDYFDVASEGESDIEMHYLGLRHILPRLLKGKNCYSPFYWILRSARRRVTLKDRLNDAAFLIASSVLPLSIPEQRHVYQYQGFMEMQGLYPFRSVEFAEFAAAISDVLPCVKQKLQSLFPPATSRYRDLVFPSGSAHQIMPPEFAMVHFPEAQFAFYERDPDAEQFRRIGLSVVNFGRPPEDVVRLIAGARRTFSTDSFSSHLAQTWRDDCYVLLTEQKAEMVVLPGFPETQIVRSAAPCHPCRHKVRLNQSSVCDAGLYYCCTWNLPDYIERVNKVNSIEQKEI